MSPQTVAALRNLPCAAPKLFFLQVLYICLASTLLRSCSESLEFDVYF